ncbi:MAG: ribonuclease Z [Lewinellaceae bacterium]|nr:ribonuclease Z [Saprospiraceae bacterium]MCB9330804.1 ribonuclease Z [Lewinellaceae bacterium]
MQVTILGTSSGGPFHGRNYTAQVLQVENHYFLIDCGEGTQQQLYNCRVPYDRFQQIFISHLHGDHVFGLIGLLTSYCLKKRTKKLELYAPPGLQELIEQTARLSGVLFPYELVFHEVDASVSKLVFENKQVEVYTIPLMHRCNCSGWLFREKQKPRNIRKEKIDEYGIAIPDIKKIKNGEDLLLADGRVIPNSELTLPPTAPRAYAFCSDTAPSNTVAKAVQGVDLLYHEATFTDEHVEEARLSYHSTARQAAEIARKAGVKKLLLGHFSGRYTDLERHLAEACSVFPETEIATECRIYSV